MDGYFMSMEQAKTTVQAANELSESGKDLFFAVRGTKQVVADAKKLWLEGNKSRLIKIGVACIMFPDPSPVGEIVGAGFLAAGLVQKGVRKQYLYLGGLKKNLDRTLQDLRSVQQDLHF
jgi:hypothetical protein